MQNRSCPPSLAVSHFPCSFLRHLAVTLLYHPACAKRLGFPRKSKLPAPRALTLAVPLRLFARSVHLARTSIVLPPTPSSNCFFGLLRSAHCHLSPSHLPSSAGPAFNPAALPLIFSVIPHLFPGQDRPERLDANSEPSLRAAPS